MAGSLFVVVAKVLVVEVSGYEIEPNANLTDTDFHWCKYS